MLKIFDRSDAEYLRWIESHADGFVVNTRRRDDPSYMVLHRASCSSVRRYSKVARSGAFTERAYRKVAADTLAELEHWVERHGRSDRTFSAECPMCKPR